MNRSDCRAATDAGATAEQIVSCARPRLAAAGFELLTFTLTQLSIAAAPRGTSD